MLPHGFKFNPTDEELIQILDGKVRGQEMPLHFIVQSKVYDHEPQDLERNQGVTSSDNERYYYCKKENDSREVFGRGWWKATSHVKKVQPNERLFGYKRPLTYHRFKDMNRNRKNAIKTNWIMHEYSLESRITQWRLCRIKYKGNRNFKEQEEIEKMRQNCPFTDNSNSMIRNEVASAGAEQLEYPLTLANFAVSAGNNAIHSPYLECWNMEQQLPQHSYGDPSPQVPVPFLGSNASSSVVEQQERYLEFTEPTFPSPWSWQN
ncbi:hypothetical protein K2173_019041 [Erythroxylum novogranatense]|uniref:NAC domain-containing protein n=1 Tax=Erythroxylum novogranatense TaxID=1862640 RepID=A0AAV8ST56_9ROSI|nr:hypothetical protein K2173_019041 [Erythroxylum novogranatense]